MKLIRDVSTVTEREELMSANVMLDGRPARITGRLARFATVWPIGEDSRTGVTFAWATVQHIIDKCEGKFKS